MGNEGACKLQASFELPMLQRHIFCLIGGILTCSALEVPRRQFVATHAGSRRKHAQSFAWQSWYMKDCCNVMQEMWNACIQRWAQYVWMTKRMDGLQAATSHFARSDDMHLFAECLHHVAEVLAADHLGLTA